MIRGLQCSIAVYDLSAGLKLTPEAWTEIMPILQAE